VLQKKGKHRFRFNHLKLLEKPPFQAFFIVKKGRFLKLTLTSWLGNWSITALVFSSWLVKWEGRFVAAALDDWVVLANTSIAVVVSHESALDFVKKNSNRIKIF